MNDKARQFITLLFIIGMVAMSIIGQVSDLGGQAIDETSDENYTLLNPAPYAFSIWGLIYLGLLGFGIYQALPSQRENPRFQMAYRWVIVNAIANMLWYPAAYRQVWDNIVANLLIIVMLFSLVQINRALLIRQTNVPAGETWLARMPFAIYFGWVTVATVVSIASLLTYFGWNGGAVAPDIWAVITLLIALIIACLAYLRVTNFAYLLVIAWGYIAIAVEQQDTSAVVYWSALVGALLAIVVGIATFFAKNQTAVVTEGR
ncbi:MAG: tryptophan-rich sensory protein [Saprospiraceae bacterium]